MKSTLMGWDSEQWRIVEQELGRRPGSLNSYYASSTSYDRFADAQAEWYKRFNFEPGQGPQVERKQMSGHGIDFGFACKIIAMGWRECFNRQAHVYEVRVRVGGASFGALREVPYYQVTMAYDEGFKRAVEREVHESVKREVVDKLFPNL